MRDYVSAKKDIEDLPKFYLGQEVHTADGIGIIVSLSMPHNGLYPSPEKSDVVVWFSTDRAKPWVSKEYKLREISAV